MTLKILGIDPGSRITGYGILFLKKGERSFYEISGNSVHLLTSGAITLQPKAALEKRYQLLFEKVEELLVHYSPHVIAIEGQYLPSTGKRNFSTVLKLGMSKGIVLLAAARKEIPLFEYSPSKIKQSVTGNGNASKQQVQYMVSQLLRLTPLPSEDISDAIATAICHAHRSERG